MHVGVFPLPLFLFLQRFCLPHARGGVSEEVWAVIYTIESSPCTWGCFHLGLFVDRQRLGLPHARGGVSIAEVKVEFQGMSSPCTWGCFPERVLVLFCVIVFPMHVGVFPLVAEQEQFENGLPHARGGVSR